MQRGSAARLLARVVLGPRRSAAPARRAGRAASTEQYWAEWVERCTYQGEWRDDVVRSLITVKALQYAPTGAVCAAATTSLPEQLGGVRNWDYRYSWLRDSSLTLQALLLSGYHEEAAAWQHWLQRAVAGDPGDFQIMYGVGGERRLTEVELDWLPGYEDSKPVRIGNEASEQFQLDVFGEVARRRADRRSRPASRHDRHLPAHHPQPGELLPGDDGAPRAGLAAARRRHLGDPGPAAPLHPVEGHGVGRVRPRRRRSCEQHRTHRLPIERWRTLADQVKAEVCEKGFNEEKNSFVQYYGSDQLDSSLLMLARVGFLPPDRPADHRHRRGHPTRADGRRVRACATRPRTRTRSTASRPARARSCMTTFWLVDNLALIGRDDEARALFERLRSLQNDVGMFSEEYDPEHQAADRQLPAGVLPPGVHRVGVAPLGGASVAARHPRDHGA